MNAQPKIVSPGCSVEVALRAVDSELSKSSLHYGHGTDNAWDEAVQLVLFAMSLPANSGADVLSQTVSAEQAEKIVSLLKARIKQKVPLPYLLGSAWFAGLEFKSDERALVPRSPFAELILTNFEPWYAGPSPQRVLDLCCGGGSIGLAVAHYFPNAQVDLADISEDALALAKENTVAHGLENRVNLFVTDVFANVPEERKYDLILSNPPYVNAEDLAAMPAEYQHEPAIALGSGVDGLDLTHKILARAGEYLAPHGMLFVELGYSWPALEDAYPNVPFTWLALEHGGEGIFTLEAQQWQHYSESWRR